MISYKPGDIILVPFPFTDLSSTKKRPALVVSPSGYNRQGDVVIAFITSKLRMKFATVSAEIIVKSIGSITTAEKRLVAKQLQVFFAELSA